MYQSHRDPCSHDVPADEYVQTQMMPAVQSALTRVLDERPEQETVHIFASTLREHGNLRRNQLQHQLETHMITAMVPLEAVDRSPTELYRRIHAASFRNNATKLAKSGSGSGGGSADYTVSVADEEAEAEAENYGKFPVDILLEPRATRGLDEDHDDMSSGATTPTSAGMSSGLSSPNDTLRSSTTSVPTLTAKSIIKKPAAASLGGRGRGGRSPSERGPPPQAQGVPSKPMPSSGPKSTTVFGVHPPPPVRAPREPRRLPPRCVQVGALPIYQMHCPTMPELERTALHLRDHGIVQHVTVLFLLHNETVYIDGIPFVGNKWRSLCMQFGVPVPFAAVEESIQTVILDSKPAQRLKFHNDCDTLDDVCEHLAVKGRMTQVHCQRMYCPDATEHPHCTLQTPLLEQLNSIALGPVLGKAPHSAVIVCDYATVRHPAQLVAAALATALHPFRERFVVYNARVEKPLTDTFREVVQAHEVMLERRLARDERRDATLARYRRALLVEGLTAEERSAWHEKMQAMHNASLVRFERRECNDKRYAAAVGIKSTAAAVAVQSALRGYFTRRRYQQQTGKTFSETIQESARRNSRTGQQNITPLEKEAVEMKATLSGSTPAPDVWPKTVDNTFLETLEAGQFGCLRLAIKDLLKKYADVFGIDPPLRGSAVTKKVAEWMRETVRVAKLTEDDETSEDEEITVDEFEVFNDDALSSVRIDSGGTATLIGRLQRDTVVDPLKTLWWIMHQCRCDPREALAETAAKHAGALSVQRRGYRMIADVTRLLFNLAYSHLLARDHSAVEHRSLERWCDSLHNETMRTLEHPHLVGLCMPREGVARISCLGPVEFPINGRDWTVVQGLFPEDAALPWRASPIRVIPRKGAKKHTTFSLPEDAARVGTTGSGGGDAHHSNSATFLTAGNLSARTVDSEIQQSADSSQVPWQEKFVTDEARCDETAANGYSFFHRSIPVFAFFEPLSKQKMHEMVDRLVFYSSCVWISTTRNFVTYVNDAPYAFVNRSPASVVVAPPTAIVRVRTPPPPPPPQSLTRRPSGATIPRHEPKPPEGSRMARQGSGIRMMSPNAQTARGSIFIRKASDMRASSSQGTNSVQKRRSRRKASNEDSDGELVVDVDDVVITRAAPTPPLIETIIQCEEAKILGLISYTEAERRASAALVAAANPKTGMVSVFAPKAAGNIHATRNAYNLEGCELTTAQVQVAPAAPPDATPVVSPASAASSMSPSGVTASPPSTFATARKSPKVEPLNSPLSSSRRRQSDIIFLGETTELSPEKVVPFGAGNASKRGGEEKKPEKDSLNLFEVQSYSDAMGKRVLFRKALDGVFVRCPVILGTHNIIESLSEVIARTLRSTTASACVGIGMDSRDSAPHLAAALVTWCVEHSLCDQIIDEVNELTDPHGDQVSEEERVEFGLETREKRPSSAAQSTASNAFDLRRLNLKTVDSASSLRLGAASSLRDSFSVHHSPSGAGPTGAAALPEQLPPSLLPLALVRHIEEAYADHFEHIGADWNAARAFCDALLTRTHLAPILRLPIDDFVAFVAELQAGSAAIFTRMDRLRFQKRVLETYRVVEQYLLVLFTYVFLSSRWRSERSAAACANNNMVNPTFSAFVENNPFVLDILRSVDLFLAPSFASSRHLGDLLAAKKDGYFRRIFGTSACRTEGSDDGSAGSGSEIETLRMEMTSGPESPMRDTVHIGQPAAAAMTLTAQQPFVPDPFHVLYSHWSNRWIGSENYIHTIH